MSAKSATLEAKEPPKKLRLGQQVRIGLVRDLKSSLSDVEVLVVSKMERVSTRELNQLRLSLKALQADLIVVKNSLGKMTFRDRGWTDLEKALTGTCGISPVRGDVSSVCKLLSIFSKSHEGFVLQGGILKGQLLQPQDLMVLGKLPSREVLLSQLAGIAQSPIRSFAFLLQGPIRSLAVMLSALAQKKAKAASPGGGEAPKAEEPKTEEPKAEAPKAEPPKA